MPLLWSAEQLKPDTKPADVTAEVVVAVAEVLSTSDELKLDDSRKFVGRATVRVRCAGLPATATRPPACSAPRSLASKP
jgi:hypothetical protein